MQPYTNPYYFQNNPSYVQPQYGQINPYPDRLAQLQAQQQQFNQSQYGQQMPVQPIGLNGEVVDSIDVVKAKNVDMSGNVTFYPKSDMTEIYTKQLQADGTSRIVTYRAIQPESESQKEQKQASVDMNTINGMFGQLRMDLLNEISDLKDLVNSMSHTQATKNVRGGKQNDAS